MKKLREWSVCLFVALQHFRQGHMQTVNNTLAIGWYINWKRVDKLTMTMIVACVHIYGISVSN